MEESSLQAFMKTLRDVIKEDVTDFEIELVRGHFKELMAEQHLQTWDELNTWSEGNGKQLLASEEDPARYLPGLQRLLEMNINAIRAPHIRAEMLEIYNDPMLKLQWDRYLKSQGLTAREFWGTVHQLETNGKALMEESTEITAGALLAKAFMPIRWFAAGLLHEGMVLFGGKSKRGKSWMAMNMAVALAQGDKVFGEYEVAEPRKVLYGALEDGPRRTQRRLRDMATSPDLDNLLIAFKMPPLTEGGVEYLAEKIQDGFEVIFVDVLAHLEKAGKNGLPNYHEVYSMFAPLQALRSQHQFALIMITHLRKGESEEVFDQLHGSVAYQGTQDALWVMERRMGDNVANMHIRDKDAEDKTVQLQFDGATWSFVGEGEEHAATTQERAIMTYLQEEKKPQGVKEIMTGLGINPTFYPAFRQRLIRMASKTLLTRTDRGLYMPHPSYRGNDGSEWD